MPFVTLAVGSPDAARHPGRRASWLGRILGGLLLIVVVVLFGDRLAREMADFDVYWRAGVRAADAAPLYRAEDGHYQLKYLPAFAVLVMPLGALPRDLAAALWFTSSLIVLWAVLAVSLRLLPERRKPVALLIAAVLIVYGKFYTRELLLGQVNLLFALVVAMALLLMAQRREALAGACVALAIVLKPYAVLLLPWLAARREPASILSAGAGLLAVLLLPAAIYGLGGNVVLHLEWLDVVLSSTAPNLQNPDNVSWLAMYSRLLGSGPAALALAAATALVVLGSIAWVFAARHRIVRPEPLEGALLLTVMPFLSPQGWDYVLLIATPAVLLLVNDADRLPRPWRLATYAALLVTGLTLHDLMGRTLYHGFLQMSGITICFFVIIAALVQLRRRGLA